MLRVDLIEGRTRVISLEDASIATVGRFITWLYSGSIIGKHGIDNAIDNDVKAILPPESRCSGSCFMMYTSLLNLD